MSDPQARTLADRLEHFYLLTGDEGQALLVEVMARLRSVPVVPDNASELRASGATSSGGDEETIERVCTAIAAIGSNLTAWNLRRIAVAAIEAVAPNGRGVANEREARLLAAAENLKTPFDREYMREHLLARSVADVPEPRHPQPEPAPSEDEREALDALTEILHKRATATGTGYCPSWYTAHWREWYREGAREILAALARLRDVGRSEVDVVFTTATGEPALTYLRYVGDDARPTDVRYKDVVLWMKVQPTQRAAALRAGNDGEAK